MPKAKGVMKKKERKESTKKEKAKDELLEQVHSVQLAARNGNAVQQLDNLRELTETTDSPHNTFAAASVAYILAFQGRWEEIPKYIVMVFNNPFDFDVGNILPELVAVLLRAGDELGNWTEIEKLADDALSALRASTHSEAKRVHRVDTVKFLMNKVKSAAKRKSSGEMDLMHHDCPSEQSEDERRRQFSEAVKIIDKDRKTPKTGPEYVSLKFGNARLHNLADEMINIYKEMPEAIEVEGLFDNILSLASAYVRTQQPQEAWKLLERNLKNWWALDFCQIAPVSLITDPALKEIMTPERCQTVLQFRFNTIS